MKIKATKWSRQIFMTFNNLFAIATTQKATQNPKPKHSEKLKICKDMKD